MYDYTSHTKFNVHKFDHKYFLSSMAQLASARFYASEPVAKQLQHLEIMSRCSFDGEYEKIIRLCGIIGPICCIIHDQCNVWRNTSAPKKHEVSPNGCKKICFTRKPLVGVNPTTENHLLGAGEGEMRVHVH